MRDVESLTSAGRCAGRTGALFFLLVIGGCAGASGQDSPGNSFEARISRADDAIVGLDDARWVAWRSLDTDLTSLRLDRRVTVSGSPVYFGKSESRDAGAAATPVVVRRAGNEWVALPLDHLQGKAFVHVCSGPAPSEVWGVLDALGEGSAESLHLVHSTDSGKSWATIALPKPAQAARFAALVMGAKSDGMLIAYLRMSAGDSHRGLYSWRTRDGGATWTGPTNDVDATTNADYLAGRDGGGKDVSATELFGEDVPETHPAPSTSEPTTQSMPLPTAQP